MATSIEDAIRMAEANLTQAMICGTFTPREEASFKLRLAKLKLHHATATQPGQEHFRHEEVAVAEHELTECELNELHEQLTAAQQAGQPTDDIKSKIAKCQARLPNLWERRSRLEATIFAMAAASVGATFSKGKAPLGSAMLGANFNPGQAAGDALASLPAGNPAATAAGLPRGGRHAVWPAVMHASVVDDACGEPTGRAAGTVGKAANAGPTDTSAAAGNVSARKPDLEQQQPEQLQQRAVNAQPPGQSRSGSPAARPPSACAASQTAQGSNGAPGGAPDARDAAGGDAGSAAMQVAPPEGAVTARPQRPAGGAAGAGRGGGGREASPTQEGRVGENAAAADGSGCEPGPAVAAWTAEGLAAPSTTAPAAGDAPVPTATATALAAGYTSDACARAASLVGGGKGSGDAVPSTPEGGDNAGGAAGPPPPAAGAAALAAGAAAAAERAPASTADAAMLPPARVVSQAAMKQVAQPAIGNGTAGAGVEATGAGTRASAPTDEAQAADQPVATVIDDAEFDSGDSGNRDAGTANTNSATSGAAGPPEGDKLPRATLGLEVASDAGNGAEAPRAGGVRPNSPAGPGLQRGCRGKGGKVANEVAAAAASDTAEAPAVAAAAGAAEPTEPRETAVPAELLPAGSSGTTAADLLAGVLSAGRALFLPHVAPAAAVVLRSASLEAAATLLAVGTDRRLRVRTLGWSSTSDFAYAPNAHAVSTAGPAAGDKNSTAALPTHQPRPETRAGDPTAAYPPRPRQTRSKAKTAQPPATPAAPTPASTVTAAETPQQKSSQGKGKTLPLDARPLSYAVPQPAAITAPPAGPAGASTTDKGVAAAPTLAPTAQATDVPVDGLSGDGGGAGGHSGEVTVSGQGHVEAAWPGVVEQELDIDVGGWAGTPPLDARAGVTAPLALATAGNGRADGPAVAAEATAPDPAHASGGPAAAAAAATPNTVPAAPTGRGSPCYPRRTAGAGAGRAAPVAALPLGDSSRAASTGGSPSKGLPRSAARKVAAQDERTEASAGGMAADVAAVDVVATAGAAAELRLQAARLAQAAPARGASSLPLVGGRAAAEDMVVEAEGKGPAEGGRAGAAAQAPAMRRRAWSDLSLRGGQRKRHKTDQFQKEISVSPMWRDAPGFGGPAPIKHQVAEEEEQQPAARHAAGTNRRDPSDGGRKHATSKQAMAKASGSATKRQRVRSQGRGQAAVSEEQQEEDEQQEQQGNNEQEVLEEEQRKQEEEQEEDDEQLLEVRRAGGKNYWYPSREVKQPAAKQAAKGAGCQASCSGKRRKVGRQGRVQATVVEAQQDEEAQQQLAEEEQETGVAQGDSLLLNGHTAAAASKCKGAAKASKAVSPAPPAERSPIPDDQGVALDRLIARVKVEPEEGTGTTGPAALGRPAGGKSKKGKHSTAKPSAPVAGGGGVAGGDEPDPWAYLKFPQWVLDAERAARKTAQENLDRQYWLTAAVVANNQHEQFFVNPEVAGTNGDCSRWPAPGERAQGRLPHVTTMLVAFNPVDAETRQVDEDRLVLEDMTRPTPWYEAYGVFVVVARGREHQVAPLPPAKHSHKRRQRGGGDEGDEGHRGGPAVDGGCSLHSAWTEPQTHGGLVVVPVRFTWFGVYSEGEEEPWAYVNLYAADPHFKLEALVLSPDGNHQRMDYMTFIRSCTAKQGESDLRGAVLVWRPTEQNPDVQEGRRPPVMYDMLQLKDIHPRNPYFAGMVLEPLRHAPFPGSAVPPLHSAPVENPESVRWTDWYQ